MTDIPKRPRGRPRKSPPREAAYTRPYALTGIVSKTVRLEPAEAAKLVELAKRNNESQAEAIRRLIRKAK